MKKLLATTAIVALVASPAIAGDDTDVDQVLNGTQDILNQIDLTHNANGVEQTGTNLGNVINIDVDDAGESKHLDDVTQDSLAVQEIDNEADGVFSLFRNIEQSGTNVANMVDLHDLENIDQEMYGDQTVDNDIDFRRNIDVGTQEGINIANFVDADDVDVYAKQSVFPGVDQEVDNDITLDAAPSFSGYDQDDVDTAFKGALSEVTQDGTNLANVLNAEGVSESDTGDVGDIDQDMYGDQEVDNDIKFGHFILDSAQSGTNVANMADVDTFQTLDQYTSSKVDQDVFNTATFVNDGSGLSGPKHQIGRVNSFEQSGTNLANVLTAGSLPSLSGTMEITQEATVDQVVVNDLNGYGGISGIVQSAVNGGNIIGLDD